MGRHAGTKSRAQNEQEAQEHVRKEFQMHEASKMQPLLPALFHILQLFSCVNCGYLAPTCSAVRFCAVNRKQFAIIK